MLLDKQIYPQTESPTLSTGETLAVIYHQVFNYPLKQAELIKWTVGQQAAVDFEQPRIRELATKIKYRNGYYCWEDQTNLIFQRLLKKRISDRKKDIARRACRILTVIPTIQFVGITGSLAMDSADENSDIDLLIIVKRDTLWITRLTTYLALKLSGIGIRQPGRSERQDKLCLNMWLDESGLAWRGKRSLFTAHEIAQILPVINKNQTFEKLIFKNNWIKNYWPNACRSGGMHKNQIGKQTKFRSGRLRLVYSAVDSIAYQLQRFYMRGKITQEKIGKHQAIFHPFNWEKIVSAKLNSWF